MALRVLVDETVLFDYLGERRAYLACRDELAALELSGCVRMWTTPSSCQRLLRSFSGVVPAEDAQAALGSLLKYVRLCAPSTAAGFDVEPDAGDGAFPFDCLVSRAERCGHSGSLPVFAPEELLASLERESGLVFELVDF